MGSAFQDQRFSPVEAEELKEIDLEISVLSPLKRVKSPEEIVPGRDGILISKQRRTGVFLPKVEGGYFNPETGNIIPKP